MSEQVISDQIYEVPAAVKGQTASTPELYPDMYQRSVQDPERFWSEQAEKFVTWFKKWDKVLEWDFHTAQIKWFIGGKLNVSYNCLDRHIEAGAGGQTAIIWQGNDPSESRKLTYAQLHEQVCKFANALKSVGVQKGDRGCISMQM